MCNSDLARHFKISLPEDALDLFPMKIGPRIIHFPGTDQILKIGPNVTKAEADAMRLVSLKTSVPIPKVFAASESGDSGFILMSKIHG